MHRLPDPENHRHRKGNPGAGGVETRLSTFVDAARRGKDSGLDDHAGDGSDRTVCDRRGLHFSDGKYKGHGNKKNGNKYLAWAFSEAAELARRYDPLCRTFFDRKTQKKNRMVAHQALAHKLARAAYYIMRDGVTYQQEKLFGQRIGWGGEPEQGLAAQPQDTIGNRPSH